MSGYCDPPKEYRFTSENQPAPSKKRVPKLKAQLKRDLAKNYEAISKKIIDKSKEGSIKHIEFLRDWLYGRVKEEFDVNTNIKYKELSDEELEKRIKELYDKNRE